MYRILYVDDEKDLLELSRIFLEQSSEFHVDTHVSAQDALASPGISEYDAIVSDYQMPGMDGIAFLKEIRRRFGKIPFILFTGKGREEVVIDAINNGVDFYIQKGGAPVAQFAELAHKIRQAILRQNAEQSLVESEKRLADIINFLPDGTFAIDRNGVVIAWNHALEEMTGVPAKDILGKGDYEYAIPFYGTRRPILIDMIGQPAETINTYYSNFSKKGSTLTAESDLPHLQGNARILLANASPLYNRQGELAGAIETIRDITDSRKAEEELKAAYEQITAGNEELRGQYEELTRSEQMIREGEARMKFLLGFYERTSVPEKELLNYAIEGAGIVTASPMGYLAFLSNDERELTMYAWSKSTMKECSIADKPLVYSTEKTGLWGEAVRQRKPVITNDYAAPNPAKKGYPEGHPKIIRHMNIPVIDNGHIVLVAGVANKSGLYTKNDVQELSLLMQGLWQVLKRRRTEEALRESETRFRFIAENMEDMLRQLDKNGIILYISPSVVSITGYTPEELLGKSSSGFIHPDDAEQVIQQSEAAIVAHKSSMRVDYRFRHKNGDYRLYESETKLIYDESGEYTGMIISSRDVTQRREMEIQLKESEAKYRRIADNSPDIIYRMALPSGQYEYISNAALAITGYAPEEIYANPEFLRSVIHPDWQDYLHRQWNELLEGRVPPEYEYQIIDRAGRVHWLNQRNVLVTGEDGKSVALEGIVTDITDRKQAEAALLEKTDEVNRFFTASIDLLCIADTDGYFRHLNPEWEKALGYPLTELEGHRFLDLVHPEDLDATRAVVADLAAQKEVIDFINRYRHRDGSYRWIEWRAFPKGPLIYAAARDITTRKAIEKALQEANRKLNLLNSITRHDVMNQVTVLSGYAQIAAMKKTDPVIAEYLERINTAAGTIARQIEFTKTYQDLGVKAPVWNRLGDMVARTDIRLPVSFSGTCRGTEVFADTMLERVFFNLFDNAARHGVKATRVLVRCEKQPEGLVVFVEDDGIGIPDAEKEKIFHRGYGKNTGLGLFLAREILAITGITIRETGTPGTGARFEILVPPGSYRTVE